MVTSSSASRRSAMAARWLLVSCAVLGRANDAADEFDAFVRSVGPGGTGVVVVGAGGAWDGAAASLVAALADSLDAVVVAAARATAALDGACASPRVHCFVGALGRVPLAPGAAAAAASLDGWDLSEASGAAHVAALRELLAPGGRLLLRQSAAPPGGSLPSWDAAIARGGFAAAAAGAWERRGAAPPRAARGPPPDVCALLAPACEAVLDGNVLRALPGARHPAASLYEAARRLGSKRVIQRRFDVRVPRASVPEEKHPRFETVPRDDRSSKNQPKRVENGRDRSL